VAKTSHTPHALAFSVFQTEKKFPKNAPANPSIRELARLAQSDADLWADVFISNRDAILASILEAEKKGIHPLKDMLRNGDRAGIARFIKQANRNSSHT
jgi:prephenate dehydrogenase